MRHTEQNTVYTEHPLFVQNNTELYLEFHMYMWMKYSNDVCVTNVFEMNGSEPHHLIYIFLYNLYSLQCPLSVATSVFLDLHTIFLWIKKSDVVHHSVLYEENQNVIQDCTVHKES